MPMPIFTAGRKLRASELKAIADQVDALTSSYFEEARKTALTSRASTTVQAADPHLTIPLPASTVWHFSAVLLVSSAANAAGDLAFQFTAPAGATLDVGHLALHDSLASGSSGTAEGAGVGGSGSPSLLMAAGASTTVTTVQVEGRIVFGVTAGSLTLTWAQLASNANATTLNVGSKLTARRLD